MKKIIYLLMAFTLVFTTACDPMEDVYEEIGSTEKTITGEVDFTIPTDDYKKKADDGGLGLSYTSFNSIDDAKELIPSYLTSKYPVWGKGSLAAVSFDVYSSKKTEESLVVYEVSESDYDALGFSYGNFSKLSHIIEFLEWKYPNPADKTLVSLTYNYFSGTTNTLNNGFFYQNNTWEFIQGFTDDEYNVMGESYDNFPTADIAERKISIMLPDYYKFSGKVAGDIVSLMYKIYQKDYDDIDNDGKVDDSATYSFVTYFIFDGSNWTKYKNLLVETIKFGHNGTTWVPDNTIKYTLTGADYALTGDDKFGNYYVKGMSEEDALANEVIPNLNVVLKNNFPNAEVGQKYACTYNIYNGAGGVWTTTVILTEVDNELVYVLFE